MAGFFVACLVILGILALAGKVIAAWRRFLSDLRGEPTQDPARPPNGDHAGIIYYRTRNGRSDYKFRIERAADGGYRAYILEHPRYGARGTDNHATHRLSDGRGYYVCWTQRLDTPEQARKVAAFWADKTEDYILKGRRF
jgi:hypothetical protein